MDPSLYEQVLARNVDWLASTSCGCFFQTIVRHLCQVLELDGAMISRVGEGDQAELVAVWLSGGPAVEGSFNLPPGDEFLRQSLIAACWGAPLHDVNDKQVGTLWLMHRGPFERPEQVKSIARLYAPRLARELSSRPAQAQSTQERVVGPVIANAPEAVVTVDVNATIVSWNHGAEVMFGRGEGDVLGHSVLEVFPEHDHADVLRELPVLASGGPSRFSGRITTMQFLRKSGEQFDAELSITPWRQGGQVYFSAILRDVSARAGLEQKLSSAREQLSIANAQLAQQSQVRNAFLATISDELRTPLSAVVGLSEAMTVQAGGRLSEDDRAGLGLILKSGRALKELIDDLLLFSRLTAGVTRLELRRQELGPLLVASVRQARASARAKGLELELEVGGAREVFVDESLFMGLVSALLSNAIKFTPAGGKVSVVCRGDAEAGIVQLSVTDTGIGIAPHDFGKILEPFAQVDDGLARQYRGAGVGLCIVQRLCELHGGSLQIDSAPEKGSTFTVSLPWSATGIKPRVPTRKPGLALVAEANELSSQRVCEHLESLGWQTARARTGEEAGALAFALEPDLVLMALQLPGADALEMLAALKGTEELRDTPFAVMTSLSLPDVSERSAKAGAGACFSKPLSLGMLSDWMEANGVL